MLFNFMEQFWKKVSLKQLPTNLKRNVLSGLNITSRSVMVTALTATVLLAGCGGGGSAPPSVLTGVFVDNVASNVKYVTSSGVTGRTNANGQYQYKTGDTITFSVGDIVLGSIPASSIVSVLGFQNGVQAAVLLQSIDTDQNPANGIQISNATFASLQGKGVQLSALNLNNQQAVTAFEQATGVTITQNATAAVAHAQKALKLQKIKTLPFYQYYIGNLNLSPSRFNAAVLNNSAAKRLNLYFSNYLIQAEKDLIRASILQQQQNSDNFYKKILSGISVASKGSLAVQRVASLGSVLNGVDVLSLPSGLKKDLIIDMAGGVLAAAKSAGFATIEDFIRASAIDGKTNFLNKTVINKAIGNGGMYATLKFAQGLDACLGTTKGGVSVKKQIDVIGCTTHMTTELVAIANDLKLAYSKYKTSKAMNTLTLASAYIDTYFRMGGDINKLRKHFGGLTNTANMSSQATEKYVLEFILKKQILTPSNGILTNGQYLYDPVLALQYITSWKATVYVATRKLLRDYGLNSNLKSGQTVPFLSVSLKPSQISTNIVNGSTHLNFCYDVKNESVANINDLQVDVLMNAFGVNNNIPTNQLANVSLKDGGFLAGSKTLSDCGSIVLNAPIAASIVAGGRFELSLQAKSPAYNTTVIDTLYLLNDGPALSGLLAKAAPPTIRYAAIVNRYYPSDVITLDASTSSVDASQGVLSYAWKQLKGANDPVVTIAGANTAIAKVTAPAIPAGNTQQPITVELTTTASISGNQTIATFNLMIVKDNIKPTVTPPMNLTLTAAQGATSISVLDAAVVNFLTGATATDNVGVVGNPPVSNDAGVSFPVGITTVTFTAKDAAGNIGTATANVTVKAATIVKPTILTVTPPANITVTALQGKNGVPQSNAIVAAFLQGATASGPSPIAQIATNALPNPLPMGVTTTVTFTATDTVGKTSSATATITVKPFSTIPFPTLASTQATVVEGNIGVSNLVFTLTLSAISTNTVTVDYATSDGFSTGGQSSALAGSDYTAINGTLNIAAGQISATVTVPVFGDTVFEPDESLSLNLSNISFATFGGNTTGISLPGLIINDDPAPTTVGKVTAISPTTAVIGQDTAFTITGTNLPKSTAMSLFDAAKCGPVIHVNGAGTSATVNCIPGVAGGVGNKPFYIKDKFGGTILNGASGLTVSVTAAPPASSKATLIASKLFNISVANIIATGNPPVGVNYAYNPWGAVDATLAGQCRGYDGGHSGIDMQTKDVAGPLLTANRTFYAVSSGAVIWAGGPSATGSNFNTIAIYDAVKNITVLYLHARSVSAVLGATVVVGDVLGIQGSTGVGTAEHVHLEVRSGKRTGPACGKITTIDPISNIVPYLQAPSAVTNRLNDTGITTWGNATVNNRTATQPLFPGQDADHGRDALAAAGTLVKKGGGKAGFDFTKLDAAGQPLTNQAATYAATPWSCIQDNVTGLMWEVKAPAGLGGLRDANHSYTWFNSTGVNDGGNAGTPNGGTCVDAINCDTEKYVAAVNAQGVCGFKDWRLPSQLELRSIIYYRALFSGAFIDTMYFPHTVSTAYWSATPTFANGVSRILLVDYSDGTDAVFFRYFQRSIRLVR